MRVGSLLGRRRRAVRYETAGGDDDARRIAHSFGCCRRWAGRWLEPRASRAPLAEHSFPARRAVRELGKGRKNPTIMAAWLNLLLSQLPGQKYKLVLQDGCLG